MPSDDHDDRIAELFACLTAQLEDAAALAAEGQQAGLPPKTRRTLAGTIGAKLQEAQAGMSELLSQLGD